MRSARHHYQWLVAGRRGRIMGRFAGVLLLSIGVGACAAPTQEASSFPGSTPNVYSLSTAQVNQMLTACRARQRELPWEVSNALCSCIIRETPRSVPREDVEALGREIDSAKRLQLIFKNPAMRHVGALCLSEAIESPATSTQQAGGPPVPLPNGGYTLTITEQNAFLTTCRAPSSKSPPEINNALCSCVIRETPRWVPREDLEAIGRETDETKSRQILLKNRPMRHVIAMCLSEAFDGLAAPN